MNANAPRRPPSFETEDELRPLLLEGLRSGEPVEMTQDEWRRFYEDLAATPLQERRAS